MKIEESVCGELLRGVEEVLPEHEFEKKLQNQSYRLKLKTNQVRNSRLQNPAKNPAKHTF